MSGMSRSVVSRAQHRASVLGAVLILWGCMQTAFAADGGAVRMPPYERVQLPNGAVLLLMERHDVPLIAFQAHVRGGAATDAPGQAGVASLLAALLEKGAGARNSLALAETIASVGGAIETGATRESLYVAGSFLARDQALAVELLADLLQRPKLEQSEFEPLRARHVEFIRAAKDSSLDSLTDVYGAAAVFGDHPYSRPVSGSEGSLARISLADLKRSYQDRVGADRLLVAVVGDFKTSQMKQLLTRAFSGWRRAAAPLPAIAAPTKVSSRRVLLIDAPEAVQSYFWAGNIGVARSDPRRASLDVANTLLGGRFTSLLNTELRINSGLSYGANSHFERPGQPGFWEMSSFTQTETTIQAIDAALQVLDRFHRDGIDAALLASGKSYVQGQFPLALETSAQWAYQLALLELYKLDRSYIDGYSAALGGVTLDKARQTIAEAFPTSENLTLVVIGKAAAIREGLRKYGPVSEMKLSDPTFAAPR